MKAKRGYQYLCCPGEAPSVLDPGENTQYITSKRKKREQLPEFMWRQGRFEEANLVSG